MLHLVMEAFFALAWRAPHRRWRRRYRRTTRARSAAPAELGGHSDALVRDEGPPATVRGRGPIHVQVAEKGLSNDSTFSSTMGFPCSSRFSHISVPLSHTSAPAKPRLGCRTGILETPHSRKRRRGKGSVRDRNVLGNTLALLIAEQGLGLTRHLRPGGPRAQYQDGSVDDTCRGSAEARPRQRVPCTCDLYGSGICKWDRSEWTSGKPNWGVCR